MMVKKMLALALSLVLAAGLCPGAALAADGLTAGTAAGRDAAPAAERGTALGAQASKEAALTKKATKLAKKAIKLMNALPKASKVKLAHAKKTAAAFDAASAATANWAAFEKVGAGTKKAFLKAFNNKFVPACYALEKLIKNTTAKTEKVQVKNVKAAPGAGSATVSWKKPGAGYRYEVYYSASKSSGYERAGSTGAAKLTVKGLDGGKTYYFKVRAYRAGIPASSLVGSLSDVAYGKYSSPAAATPKAPLAAASAGRGKAPGAAAGTVLSAQLASNLARSKDALDSCRVYLRDIKGKGKNGYKTGTLKGDLDKMRGMVVNLNEHADKLKANRLNKNYKAIEKIKGSSFRRGGEEVWQTATGLNSLTVKWGAPAIARNSEVTMLQWRISWRKLGDEKWSAPKIVAYSPYSRECAITGLSQGTTYEVRVGYRYQINNGQDGFVDVDDWRSCTATTLMTVTLSSSSFDYHFTAGGNDDDTTGIQVLIPGLQLPKGFGLEWYVTPGPAFNSSEANSDYGGIIANDSISEYSLDGYGGLSAGPTAPGLRSGHAVATVGVRVFSMVGPDGYIYDSISDRPKWTISNWTTKTLVADPNFDIVRVSDTGLVVKMPALKNAKSYTVYLGKRKGARSDKVTGWKVAGTFAAKEGKATKVLVDNYGGKKVNWKATDLSKWVVKVVTNTYYGSSPGDYWVSPYGGLVLHKGMIA